MQIKSLNEEKFLINLFFIKRGSLAEIAERTGIYDKRCGKVYRLKRQLLDEGIIEQDGFEPDPLNRPVAVFKINHKPLKQILAFEVPHLAILKKQFDDVLLRRRK